MNNKTMILIIGILLGAIIITGIFMVNNKKSNTENNSAMQMQEDMKGNMETNVQKPGTGKIKLAPENININE